MASLGLVLTVTAFYAQTAEELECPKCSVLPFLQILQLQYSVFVMLWQIVLLFFCLK